MESNDAVVQFRSAAERYVYLLDSEEGSRDDLFAELATALPTLYAAAAKLPSVVPADDEVPSGFATEERAEVLRRFEARLGERDWYQVVDPLGPGDESAERLTGSLADDLADTYLDVSKGLRALTRGTATNEVIWMWRESFWSHWGWHTANAIRVIHRVLTSRAT